MGLDEKTPVVALEDILHQFLLLSERFSEERQLLNKQTSELTKLLTRLSVQVEKHGETDRHLKDQVSSSIKGASNHMAESVMKGIGTSLNQVIYYLKEQVQNAMHTLKHYEHALVIEAWKWMGVAVFTTIFTSLLIVWFLMPKPMLPLTQQQLGDLKGGEIMRLVWPKLLIDEYDTPIQAAYMEGYYAEMINFMRGLFGSALKNNPYLNKAVITGILRIAKESLFSGVNNLEVYSLLRDEYSQHFGFTESEMDHILEKSNLSEKSAEIKEWYNGYQFGGTTIYNPWSIANCVKRRGELEPYWVDTSDNQLIKDLMKKMPLSFKEELEGLVLSSPVEKLIDEQLSFQYLDNNPDALWNLLLMAGYLKPSDARRTDQGILATLAIPNREVRNLYRQMIEQWLSNGYGVNWYNVFIATLLNGQIDEFKGHLEKVLLQIASFHDVAKEPEAFFHGLLLGFMVSLNQTYEIKSNRESGLGRYDIMLMPKEPSRFGIVIELKAKRSEETRSLESLAEEALKQIDEKHYVAEFEQRQIANIIKIGIGFQGKQFELRHTITRQ